MAGSWARREEGGIFFPHPAHGEGQRPRGNQSSTMLQEDEPTVAKKPAHLERGLEGCADGTNTDQRNACFLPLGREAVRAFVGAARAARWDSWAKARIAFVSFSRFLSIRVSVFPIIP